MAFFESGLLSFLLFVSQAATPAQEKIDAEKVFGRVIALGASLSDGFSNGLPPSTLLDKAIVPAHVEIEKITSSVFFMTPVTEGKRQVELTLKRNPTLVVGLDFLFWYSYGRIAPGNWDDNVVPALRPAETEKEISQRLALLEQGLAQLDRIPAPLVIGDLPDMWGADPGMLHPSQIPSVLGLEKLNQRIQRWAKERKNVLLLPMAQWAREMKEKKMKLGDHSLTPEQLLQEDRLHPSEIGVVVLCGKVVEAIRSWLGKEGERKLRFDVLGVLEARGIEWK